MRIVLIITLLAFSKMSNSQISFSITDELQDWRINLSDEANSRTLITQEKRKNILDFTESMDSLTLYYSADSRLFKLEVLSQEPKHNRFYHIIYHVNESGLITKKTTFKRNRNKPFDWNKPYEEYINKYTDNEIQQKMLDRFATYENRYVTDSNGNVIEEWENHKDSLWLKKEFVFDSNNRLEKETNFCKYRIKRSKSTREVEDRYLVKFDEPIVVKRFKYYNSLDTAIVEKYGSKSLDNSIKKWGDGTKNSELNTKYLSYTKSIIGRKEKPKSFYGIAKQILIESNEDTITTLIRSYASSEDFRLRKSISFLQKSDGTGYIYSTNDVPLDCKNEELNKIIVTENIFKNKNGAIEKHIIEHDGVVIYKKQIEKLH